MELHNISSRLYPAYTWFWNNTITREGIDFQIDEMCKNGIRAFYVIGEPDNWHPSRRATHLFPKYLSDEYLDLLFYAFEKAREKGIYTWLYNEGAFPSGSACGLVTEKYPELMYKYISVNKFTLQKGERYTAHQRAIAAFVGSVRIFDGHVLTENAEIWEYYWDFNGAPSLHRRVDNAERRGSEEFIKITHDRLKKRFGDYMGSEIQYMFDDEAYMGGWTRDLDKIFFKKYGYDMTDFIPCISNAKAPESDEEYRAVSDYMMLCGDLIRDNYFLLMQEWLHKTSMQSVGHLDQDHNVQGAYLMHYGNVLKTMRAFDVPGIDVIWGQISFPQGGKCCPDGMEFFPRLASSAARQIGRNIALSESFAVYGSQVTPDLMRFVVNYQAVRGINLFNFMTISNDRETPMRHQFRPNFLGDNVGMDCLKQINAYTARLSYLMQTGKSSIKTALYYPLRSICAGGEKGRQAGERFVALGEMLENKGVSFDFIDEDFVLNAKIENGVLVGEFVAYENVFVADGDLEIAEVMKKLSLLNAEICPDIKRSSSLLQSRKVIFEDGNEGYFLYNQSNERLQECIEIESGKFLYEVDLFTGDLYTIPHNQWGGRITLELSLLRGEGIFLLLASEEQQKASPKPVWEKVSEITKIRSSISRIYKIDCEKGVCNIYPDPDWQEGLIAWEESFSGEVTYIAKIPELESGEYRLNLGRVRHYAKIYVNGEKIGESTLNPYTIVLNDVKGGEELKIVVANSPANECANTDYFEKHLAKDVGPYHQRMVLAERKEAAGGLFGPIWIERKK